MSRKDLFIVGTRPELIKISPIAKSLKATVLFTNQHFSKNMSSIFFDLLSGCEIIELKGELDANNIKKFLLKFNPKTITVQGDTFSTFLGAIAAKSYSKSPIYYIESGMRNGDLREPEEVNRINVAGLADIHFVNHKNNKLNLKNEGIHKNIFITGSTVYASLVNQNLIKNENKNKDNQNYNKILITLHRPLNVDNKNRLNSLLSLFNKLNLDTSFVVHPRTSKNLEKSKFNNIKFLSPMNFRKFINKLNNSDILISDSGGLQEEAVIFKKPLLIPMTTTTRNELLEKHNFLVSTDKEITDKIYYFTKSNSNYEQFLKLNNNYYGKSEVIEKMKNYY